MAEGAAKPSSHGGPRPGRASAYPEPVDRLIAELAARQREDGSWLNTNERWLEKDPNLVTGYALLALSYCRPAVK